MFIHNHLNVHICMHACTRFIGYFRVLCIHIYHIDIFVCFLLIETMYACMHVCVCMCMYIYNGPIKKGCLQRVCAIARSLLKGSTRASGRTGLTRVASGCTKDFVAIVLQSDFAGTYTCTGTTIFDWKGSGVHKGSIIRA